MANVDQRKYLKRYLDDDQTKRRKKRTEEHASSYSERVRIIDDDGNYSRSRKYDDENDFILTGEDAPQIVGVVDDRPPELKAVEDFRNSSKWRTLEVANDRLARGSNRTDGNSQRYNDRKRSRSPIKRDYSPQRRLERKEPPAYDARKRRSDDDYSPVRRKRDEDTKPREAHYPKKEKSTSYSDDINARRREVYGRSTKGNGFGQYRETEGNNRDGHDYNRSTSYSRPHPAAYAQRSQHDGRRQDYVAENGRSTEYHQRENHPRVEYNRYSRNETAKPNPFRANSPPSRPAHVPQRNEYRKRSPAKSGGNPFRSNRPGSLSPLPSKRGDATAGDGRHFARVQKFGETRPRFENHNVKSNFTRNSTPPQYDSFGRKSSNPFREQARAPIARSSGFAAIKQTRPETSPMDKHKPQRQGYYTGFERKQESASHDYRPYRKSRSPIRSGVQIVNSQHPRTDKRYQEDKDDHSAGRFRGGGYPQQMYLEKKQQSISIDSDLSPVRRRNVDGDLSPVRKRKNVETERQNPSKYKNIESNDDLSPVRRRTQSTQGDHHRRAEKRKSDSGEDLSPIRNRKPSSSFEGSNRSGISKDTRGDLSPVRRQKQSVSPNRESKEQPSARKSRFSSPGENVKIKRTLDGKLAGLQDAEMLKKENEERRHRENDHFRKMSSNVSGRNADVVVRDKKSGRVRDLERDRAKDEEKQQREKERKEIYDKWGKGLKQVEDYRNKIASDQHESNKPLARYSNDEDLDKMLREQERAGDPMLHYMREKISKNSNAPKVPTYNGPFPDNRFGIRPGYRWDGVDRSNGYEKKWLNVQNQKVAIREEAYRYSTEDM